MTEVADKPKIVEAHFTGACAGEPIFTLIDINPEGNVIMGVRTKDLFGGDYVPVSYPHYLRGEGITFDETDIATFLRKMIETLAEKSKAVSALWQESHSTSNTERYNALTHAGGLIRQAERERDAYKAIVTLTFKEAFGIWPSGLRDLGVS